MDSPSKRHFLQILAVVSGGGLLELGGLGAALAAQAAPLPLDRRETWARDAGEVRVSPGPWPPPPDVPPGVHFESLRLRMPDGVHLAALLYLPQDVPQGAKIPAVLTVTPYREEPRPGATIRMSSMARNGYASLFLDVRGTGGSEGVPADEYAPQEHVDTAHVIDWLSKQPWANGNVGMHGGSYSAINALWVASAIKPPALKAIFVIAASDDRYTDDIHNPGGTMLMLDNSWALGMLTSNATPGGPDYAVASKASLERWDSPPWLLTFLRNQLDGPYWRQGSLAPDYGRLTTPTFMAGGYLDIYQNIVPRVMKHSPAVTKGVLGPWHHSMRWPGPVVDWEAMRIRWFDHWLKGQDTGMLREPRVSFYMPRWRRQSFRQAGPIPGDWRHFDQWPDTVFAPATRLFFRPSDAKPLRKALAMDPAPGQGGDLAEMAPDGSALNLRYAPGRGGSQSFGPTNSEGFFGIDQRDEDAFGLTFDTAALRQPIELLGFAKARLFVSATAPVANWIVQLCDVAPDGTSYLVTRGYLNATHRRFHTHPEPLEPGEVYEITVELMCTGYRFSPGHKLRIVVSNADFPVVWPSPHAMTTTLYTGGDRPSHIDLPVLKSRRYREGALPMLGDQAPAAAVQDSVTSYKVSRDYASGASTASLTSGDVEIVCQVNESDPAEASLRLNAVQKFRPLDPSRRVETRATGVLRSTADKFIVDMKVSLVENDKVLRERDWQFETPRQLV